MPPAPVAIRRFPISQAGTTPSLYLYSGEQNDPNLALDYLRARYLSQTTGRFLSAGALQGTSFEPLSLHRYVYTRNNPVNKSIPVAIKTKP